jgi:ribosome biogenesis protein BRX1
MKHNDGLSTSLVEIGPRFVMNPIRIFGGSFGGQTLYQNEDFVSPNEMRSQRLKLLSHTYDDRKKAEAKRKERQSKMVLPEDPLDSVFK